MDVTLGLVDRLVFIRRQLHIIARGQVSFYSLAVAHGQAGFYSVFFLMWRADQVEQVSVFYSVALAPGQVGFYSLALARGHVSFYSVAIEKD